MRFIYIFFATLLCFSRTVFRLFLSPFFVFFLPSSPVLALRLSCVSSSLFIAMFFSIYFVYFFVCYFMLIWVFSKRFFCIFFFTFSVFLFEHFLHLFRLLYIYVLVVFFSFAFVAFFRSRFLCAPFFHKIIVCLCTSMSSTDHYRANRSFHFFPLWACPNEMFTQP